MRTTLPKPLRATLMLCAGAYLAATSAVAAQAPPVVGTWEGFLDVGGGQGLTVVMHIVEGAGDSLTGTMDSPDQAASGIPMSEVVFSNGLLTVVVASVPGEPTYVGVLSEDGGTLNGTFTQGPGTLPLTLTRQEGPA